MKVTGNDPFVVERESLVLVREGEERRGKRSGGGGVKSERVESEREREEEENEERERECM